MKKILILSVIVAFISSCSKDVPSIPDPKSAPKVSAVPSSFVQKIVVENFTMTSCGQCPKYELILDSLVRFNPGRVFGMTVHVADPMEDTTLWTVTGRNYYDSIFNPLQEYPSGMVNRNVSSLADLDENNWSSTVFSMMSAVPSCGIALEAENVINNNLNLTVHVGFISPMPGQYNLHVLLVEDVVFRNDSTYDQLNDFSSEGATPDSALTLYHQNDTVRQYRHKFVLKEVLSNNGPLGDTIPMGASVPGNHYTDVYNIDVSNINIGNSYILVYVDKHATTFTGHRIENVQVVRIGETKDWN